MTTLVLDRTVHPTIAAALPAINSLRRSRGLDTLTELPKGVPCEAHNCVVARALGAYSAVPAGMTPGYVRWEIGGPRMTVPAVLEHLMDAFDQGLLPELVEA